MQPIQEECKLIFFDNNYLAQKDRLLLLEFCRKQFTYLPAVDFYFKKPAYNIYLISSLIVLTSPLLFIFSAWTAERFLALEMKKMASILKISQSLAAVTLLGFAASAPDIIAALSNNKHSDSTTIMASISMGIYFFGMTIITGIIAIFSVKNIVLPKNPIIKEIGFSLAIVLLVAIFGYIREVGYLFLSLIFALIFAYFLTSFLIDKYDSKQAHNFNISDLKNGVLLTISSEEINAKTNLDNSISKTGPCEIITCQTTPDKTHITSLLKEPSKVHYIITLSESLGILDNAHERAKTRASAIFYFPLFILQIITVPYENNPLKGNFLELAPLFFGMVFTNLIFGFTNHHLFSLFIFSTLTILIGVFKYFFPNNILTKLTLSIIVVFASLAWIQFFINFVIDYLTFISFYFSLDDVILKSFLLASGTSIGELFGSHALATSGAEVMAVLSVYSGGFMNMAIVMIVNTIYHMQTGIKAFDFFDLQEKKKGWPWSLDSIYVIGFTLMTVLVLLFHLGTFILNGFQLKRGLGFVLIGLYSAVFLVTIFMSFY